MARLPVVTREMVPEEFREAFDELTAATGGTITDGPVSITINSPELARREGISDALVDAIREKQPLPPTAADETAIINFGREFFNTHKVDGETFQAAVDQFGPQHLVELTALLGQYAQTAFFLNAFAVELPEERTEPVLPV